MSQTLKNLAENGEQGSSLATPTSFTAQLLIVVDQAEMAEITKLIIEKYTSIKVLMAHSGHEALTLLANIPVDVIILDMNMPDMSGAECFRLLRQRSIYVPVIFLTGKVSEECKRDQLALGAFDYIEKPVRAKDLILLLNDACRAMERIRSLLVRGSNEPTP